MSSSRAKVLAAAVLALAIGYAGAEPIRARDDRGVDIFLQQPARSIITLAPNLTELAFAAGGATRVVAADSASDYPVAAARLPHVGDAAGLDLERILALRPDLVFGWLSGNKPSDIARLERFGIPVFLSEPRRLADVPRTLRIMGILLGTSQLAEQQAQLFEQRLDAVRKTVSASRLVGVFFEVWHQPLITVNGAHLVSDVLSLCGGSNVFSSLPALAAPVSAESVLAADPEVIIASGVPKEAVALWNRMPSLRAVRTGQIYTIHPDLITRATPRILDGAQTVCEWLARARGG